MERFKSVFSNYLLARGVETHVDMKPMDIYDRLRNIYNQGAEGIIDNVEMFALHNEDEDEVIYEICINPHLRTIVRWVNKKIVLLLGIAEYRTIGVRLRIATGMINKLVHEKKLSIEKAQLIHDSLVFNLNREISAINTQDLPFLPRKPNLDWYSSGALSVSVPQTGVTP